MDTDFFGEDGRVQVLLLLLLILALSDESDVQDAGETMVRWATPSAVSPKKFAQACRIAES